LTGVHGELVCNETEKGRLVREIDSVDAQYPLKEFTDN
jgi:hypothetical protein